MVAGRIQWFRELQLKPCSLGILGVRANAECLEDRLGIMLGDGKAAFGRRRNADAGNREAYEEYSRHYCSGDGGHAGGRSRA